MNRLLHCLTLTLCATAVAGCAAMAGPKANALLQPTTGNTASGTVRFVQMGSVVQVSGEVRGLQPNAVHGFHVHEKGDCTSGDGMSTGGHFNPDGRPHGQHGMGAHHAGDLPSLRADAHGVARFSFESTTIAVGSGISDLIASPSHWSNWSIGAACEASSLSSARS